MHELYLLTMITRSTDTKGLNQIMYKIKAAKNWRLALQKGMDSVCSKDILNVLAKVFVNIDWVNRNRITFCAWFLEG
jgi:hypothetical protein